MTWYAPFTFVAGETISYEDLNKYLSDNMNETLIGKIKSGAIQSTEGQWFSTDGGTPHSVVGYDVKTAATNPQSAGGRNSTSYGPPTFTSFGTYVNPVVTINTGTRALVLVHMKEITLFPAQFQTQSAFCSVAVSGATTIAASDNYSSRCSGFFPFAPDSTTFRKVTGFFRWFTGLNPGSNTFTLQIRGNTAQTSEVNIPSMVVIPFG